MSKQSTEEATMKDLSITVNNTSNISTIQLINQKIKQASTSVRKSFSRIPKEATEVLQMSNNDEALVNDTIINNSTVEADSSTLKNTNNISSIQLIKQKLDDSKVKIRQKSVYIRQSVSKVQYEFNNNGWGTMFVVFL